MLHELRRLMKETAIYGLSTVVGRLLNFLLTPFYTHALIPAEYGLVATVFSYLAFLNVVYGHGMDFAFMRHFKEDDAPERRQAVFSTAQVSLVLWPAVVSALLYVFAAPVARAAGLPPSLAVVARYAALILFFDAAALVPFAYLRMRHKAASYAGIKLVNIALNLVLNYVFLVRAPMGVRGVFLASAVTSVVTLILLTPVLLEELRPRFEGRLYAELLRFALPILPAGIASMMVQVIDRPILQAMTDARVVGLYQANYRLGIVMMLVVNMFDAAWRPFFLQRAGKPGAEEVFARVLTYFAALAGFVFLGISLLVPNLAALPLSHGRTLIHPAYWEGLPIVPVVTLGYVFNGLYINLLAPVTLAKKTERVAFATALGALVNVGTNLLWIPRWGMMGAALATLAAYAAMAGALYLMGRKLHPIPYETGRLAFALGAALVVLLAARSLGVTMASDKLGVRLGLLLAYPAALALGGFLYPDERRALLARLRLTSS